MWPVLIQFNNIGYSHVENRCVVAKKSSFCQSGRSCGCLALKSTSSTNLLASYLSGRYLSNGELETLRLTPYLGIQ